MKQLLNKINDVKLTYIFILIPIFLTYIINNLFLSGSLSQIGGLRPYTLSIGPLTSWLLHVNFSHLLGNTLMLIPLLFIISVLNKKPLLLSFQLILLSGIIQLFLGSPNSLYIGASGFIFALFGFIFASAFYKQYAYILVSLFLIGQYIFSLFIGLIPQAGVSWSGHFSGLLAGIILRIIIQKITKK